ncbi:MAG: flippase [Armatimonadota bacterium]
MGAIEPPSGESQEPALAKNTLYSALSSASNSLLIILVVIAARVLGDTAFGYFSFALAVASIFEMLTDFGLNTLITRNLARNRKLVSWYLPNILGWKLLLSGLAVTLLIVSMSIMHQSVEARITTYIFGGAIVLRSYKNTLYAFLQAYERFDLLLLTTYTERVLVLVGCAAVLFVTRSLIGLAVTFVLVRVPDLLFAYYLFHRKIARVHIGFDVRNAALVHRVAVPLGAYGAVLMIYSYVGTLAVALLRLPEEVGWYNAGYKVYEGLTMLPYLVGTVLLPRLSRLFNSDRDQHRLISLRVLTYLILISIPVAISVGALAPSIILLIYGEDYSPAVPVLMILAGAAMLMFLNWTFNTILISANKEKSVLKISSSALIVSIIASSILISRAGITGAAYSVLFTELYMLALLVVFTSKTLFSLRVHSAVWRAALACGIAAGTLGLRDWKSPIVFVFLFLPLYGLSLLGLTLINPEERSLIGKALATRCGLPR